jgi:uncharacterized protein (DUF2235 family)
LLIICSRRALAGSVPTLAN